MNREEIIQLAREAGFAVGLGSPVHHKLNAFAALVAAAERNSWPAEMEAMERQVNILTDALAQAKAEEREACAKVADSISEDQWALYKGRPPYTGQEPERASDYTQGKSDGAEVCAAAIRAREHVLQEKNA